MGHWRGVGCWVLLDTGYMIRGAYCYLGYGVGTLRVALLFA